MAQGRGPVREDVAADVLDLRVVCVRPHGVGLEQVGVALVDADGPLLPEFDVRLTVVAGPCLKHQRIPLLVAVPRPVQRQCANGLALRPQDVAVRVDTSELSPGEEVPHAEDGVGDVVILGQQILREVEVIRPALGEEVEDLVLDDRRTRVLVLGVDPAVGAHLRDFGAVLGHQRCRQVRRVVFLDDVRVVERRLRSGRLVRCPQNACADELDVVVTGECVGERLACPDVVERGTRRIRHRETLLIVVRLIQLDAVERTKRQDGVRVGGTHHVDVSGCHGAGSEFAIRVDVELDGVEVGGVTPVVGVSDEPGHGVLHPAVEHERTGADRSLVQRRIVGRGHHVCQRGNIAQLTGEITGEIDVRTLRVVADRHVVEQFGRLEGLRLRVVGREQRPDGDPDGRVVELHLQRIQNRFGSQRRPVVERDPFPNLEVPCRVVVRMRPRLGEGRYVVAPARVV